MAPDAPGREHVGRAVRAPEHVGGPWVLEAEIASLGLVPLVVPGLTNLVLVLVLSFYAVAIAVNLHRIWTITEALDTEETR